MNELWPILLEMKGKIIKILFGNDISPAGPSF